VRILVGSGGRLFTCALRGGALRRRYPARLLAAGASLGLRSLRPIGTELCRFRHEFALTAGVFQPQVSDTGLPCGAHAGRVEPFANWRVVNPSVR
jgi:hypothetical protein